MREMVIGSREIVAAACWAIAGTRASAERRQIAELKGSLLVAPTRFVAPCRAPDRRHVTACCLHTSHGSRTVLRAFAIADSDTGYRERDTLRSERLSTPHVSHATRLTREERDGRCVRVWNLRIRWRHSVFLHATPTAVRR